MSDPRPPVPTTGDPTTADRPARHAGGADGAPADAPEPAAPAPDPADEHLTPEVAAQVHGHGHGGGKHYKLALALAALGVVYGDIGTSPLYALKECFHVMAPTPANVLGILSLVFWALLFVISFKYLAFVMRADNAGEGGILSLMALATQGKGGDPRKRPSARRRTLIAMGIFGSALLYGDGIITPAISVLSAVEGLQVATPVFAPYVVPITLAVLVGLFLVQSRGTAGIGRVFGPITVLWFLTLAVIGVVSIAQNPAVLAAANPLYGARFFLDNGLAGFLVLGSVFLVVTGGEALYADMGHFGAGPIRLAWFTVVLPALLLNYFGQGALLLRDPAAHENPLFHMVPEWGVVPLVVLATLATVIASQAVVTGAFSLTMQAIQLGYYPRVRVVHTSKTEFGQVFVPSINWALAVGCIALVVSFGSSTALAAAYGIAVTSTMAITTILLFVVMRRRWNWPMWTAIPLTVAFLAVDFGFFGANVVKVFHGGWVPLALAVLMFVIMATWRKGREILAERLAEGALPLELALPDISKRVHRVAGTGVFLHGNPKTTPPALLHNLKHLKVIHERVVFLRVEVLDRSHVPREERFSVAPLGDEFYRVTLRYGFAEVPDVAVDLQQVPLGSKPLKQMETTYLLGRERVISSDRPGMALWRDKLFSAMSNNATSAADFFGIPPGQVIEIGARVEI